MKKKSARSLALLMAAAMTATIFPGTKIPTVHAADEWIGADQLADSSVKEPEPDKVLPNENQYNYQKEELAAFCHFGPNTFNEIEWGEHYDDRTPNDIFKLTKDFDAETLVKAVKNAGFHKLIVTAKHHDGFCIWASKYTDYDVDAATNYPGDAKTGNRDILEEISAACTAEDIDMGLYLSPWDIHDKSYGYYDKDGKPTTAELDVLDYNKYYNNQLTEILSNDKYGNNGHFVEVWMDGAKGDGANAQQYDFKTWFDTIQKYEGKASGKYDSDCMLFGADAYTTVRWIGNENGEADKNTWSKSKVDYKKNTIDSNKQGRYTIGFEDGNQWTVPESDARITSGWFWGTAKAAPKSLEELGTMYFNSVGHNSPLLLNIPPNNQGTVDDAILKRLSEFGQNIKDSFDENFAAAKEAEVKASNVRGKDTAFSPANTVDGKDNTYWTTDEGQNSGSLLINLGSARKFDIVSIEEAIQNGQRINNYRVEYRNGNGAWTLLDEGTTIGAKRLIRTSVVTADQVKITVGTSEGKVPMISEVGVFKASKGFELASAAPDGMNVIDIEDSDLSDGAGFTLNGKWTKETGSGFVNETNRWANQGADLSLKFNGTKVYLVGTTDPNHGEATITIDEGEPVKVNTAGGKRATGQIWFSSEDLNDGPHTLKLHVDTKAVGIEAAYVINNGGVGMIGLEADEFTMNEDETMNVKVTRVGGTNGSIQAYLSPNPGSAVQGDFETAPAVVTLADGESETTVPVTTKRNTKKTGTQDFTIVLNTPSSGLIIGFIDTATVNILDAESMTKEQLQELVDSVDGWSEKDYTGDWNTFESALANAKSILAQDMPDALAMTQAYTALKNAKENLKEPAQFTAENPVIFPTRQGQTVVAEAERMELDHTGAASGKEIRVIGESTGSNGKHVGWFENGNSMSMHYYADQPGTYTVKMTFASGRPQNNKNNLTFAGDKLADSVTEEFMQTNSGDWGTVWQTREFDIQVNQAGAGVIHITTTNGGPNLDKFEITRKDAEPAPAEKFNITANVEGGHGTAAVDPAEVTSGGEATVTFTPDEGYTVGTVTVNGVEVETSGNSYTLSDITENKEVKVTYVLDYYTTDAPFYFPAEIGAAGTVQAEHFILHDNNDGKGEIRESAADWAEGGKFVNWFNAGDSIVLNYFAQTAGEYKFTMRYQSGSASNAISWSGDKIESGSLEGVTADSSDALQPRTVEFNVNITEAGAGQLTIEAGQANAPQTDQFVIELVNKTGTPVGTDKTGLEELIGTAQEDAAMEDIYTEESLNALETAIQEADKVFKDPEATQQEVAEQIALLQEAIHQLEKLPSVFAVTADAGANGKIELAGDAQDGAVEKGQSADYTVTANEGFVIDTLTVDGQAVEEAAGQKSYTGTVADVQAAVTINATFKEESTQPVPEEPAKGEVPEVDKETTDSGKTDMSGQDRPSAGNDKSQSAAAANKDKVTAVQTGDNTDITIWVLALAAAAAAGSVVIVIRRRNAK